MNRRRIAIGLMVVTMGAGAGGLLLSSGCSNRHDIDHTVESTAERQRQLVALAAEEAARVAEVDRRLTRQLNLAEQQIQRGWPGDARATLAGAVKTLGSDGATALGHHVAISGWVSVSELARQASGQALAESACDRAVEALLAVESPAERCQYVLGVANEVHHLKAEGDAAAVLEKAGPWARHIDDLTTKRSALVAFASALFNLDEYERGQRVLRCDEDAAWRSDMLLALAGPPSWRSEAPTDIMRSVRPASIQALSNPAEEAAASTSHGFGKRMDYEAVFRQRDVPQTDPQGE